MLGLATSRKTAKEVKITAARKTAKNTQQTDDSEIHFLEVTIPLVTGVTSIWRSKNHVTLANAIIINIQWREKPIDTVIESKLWTIPDSAPDCRNTDRDMFWGSTTFSMTEKHS